jgi:hypothetical protein
MESADASETVINYRNMQNHKTDHDLIIVVSFTLTTEAANVSETLVTLQRLVLRFVRQCGESPTAQQ